MARQKLTIPKGRACYPKLNEPDYRFKEDGEYSVTVALDPSQPAVKAFVKQIDEIYKNNYDLNKLKLKGKALKEGARPYKIDPDSGEVLVKCSLKPKVVVDGKAYFKKPKLLDAKLQPFSNSVEVGGGSIMAVGVLVNEWYTAALGAGVSLWIDAVVVYQRVVYDPTAAYGFATDDDGFDAASAAEEFKGEEVSDADLAGPVVVEFEDGVTDDDF